MADDLLQTIRQVIQSTLGALAVIVGGVAYILYQLVKLGIAKKRQTDEYGKALPRELIHLIRTQAETNQRLIELLQDKQDDEKSERLDSW